MTRIAVLGGTGYAGSHIVAEAVRRGHTVLSVARNVPAERVEHATVVQFARPRQPASVTGGFV